MAPKYWTQERIIQRLHEWNRIHGEGPMAGDWFISGKKDAKGRAYWPSTSIVQREFGSWTEAKLAAGLEVRLRRSKAPVPRRHPNGYWTKEKIIALIQEWAVEYGDPPTGKEWTRARDFKYPAATVVTRVFGSWNTAIIAAGFLPRPTGLTKRSIHRYLPLPRKTPEHV